VSKGQETKQRIIAQAAEYLNQRGYFSTAVSEIMEVTGMQKGGISTISSKEDPLAGLRLWFRAGVPAFAEALKGKDNATIGWSRSSTIFVAIARTCRCRAAARS
jgi:hypothetical protein